jgi:hypothetical protein
MASDDLLDALIRREGAANLVDFQVSKEVRFGEDHRAKLAAVQDAVNPHIAPVADSAVRAVWERRILRGRACTTAAGRQRAQRASSLPRWDSASGGR